MSIANAKQSLTFATVASASLAADATSDTLDANAAQVVTTAIQLAWTGTPTGSVYIDGSLDGANWSQLATIALAGSAGASLNEVTSCALSLRVRYVRSSGTGTLTGVYLSRTGGSLAGASAGAASHVIVDSGVVSLPTGASTAAKQPALGVAGTASADVLTMQGIASMTPLKVDGSAVTQPVSGTVTANIGTVAGLATAAKQPALGVAGTASTDVITVQGIASGTPQPVSAASLPLPTGAATSAKQAALGTAGSASADVLSVQGVASMTALKVDGSAVTQPVSNASLPLPAGAATAAKQPALGTAGSASTDVITVQGIASGTAQPVLPAPISARVAGTDTNVAAGTRRTFPSTVHTQGFYFSNIHANAIAYVGDPSTVSSTVYDFRLLPGQRSEWLPFANPNVFGWDTDTSGMILKTVGG